MRSKQSKGNKTDAIRNFQSALNTFAASSRYAVFERVLVPAFVKFKGRPPKVLGETSLGELVTIGAAHWGAQKGVTVPVIESLTQALLKVSDTPLTSLPPPPPKRTSPVNLVNSVEAEEKLTTAISKLRNYSKLSTVGLNRLGDYWEEGWIRAPFEEAFTLQQLAKMQPRALLEKRSFTNDKLLAVVKVVEKVLGGINKVQIAAEVSGSEVRNDDSSLPRTQTKLSLAGWRNDLAKASSFVSAALSVYEREVSTIADLNTPLARILLSLPMSITGKEYMVAVLANDYEISTIGEMLKLDRDSVSELLASGSAKVRSLFKREARDLAVLWAGLLNHPAAALKTFIESAGIGDGDESFFSSIVGLLLQSLDGRKVTAFGTTVPDFVSSKPKGLELAISAIAATLPRSQAEIKEACDSLIPGFDQSIFNSLLGRFAVYRDKEQDWVAKKIS